MEAQPHRPVAVTVMAILAFIAFLIDALVTLLLVGVIPAALLGAPEFFGSLLLGAVLWGLCAALWALATVGLLESGPRAWLFLVFVAMLNLILAIASAFGSLSWQPVVPTIIINGIILLYGLLSGAVEASDRAGSR